MNIIILVLAVMIIYYSDGGLLGDKHTIAKPMTKVFLFTVYLMILELMLRAAIQNIM